MNSIKEAENNLKQAIKEQSNFKKEQIKLHPKFSSYGILPNGKIINTATGNQVRGRKCKGHSNGYMRVSYEGGKKEIYENQFIVECLIGQEITGHNYEDYIKSVCKWYDYQKVTYRQLSPYRIRWERQDGTTVFFANSEQLRKATGIKLYNCITKTTRKKVIKSVRSTPQGVKSYTIVVEKRFL